MKKLRGKHLWLRNNASSIISIIFESFIIISILYASNSLIGNYETYSSTLYLIFNLILIRSIIAVLDTPILYVVVKILGTKCKDLINQDIREEVTSIKRIIIQEDLQQK